MDDYIKRSEAVNSIDEALKRVFVTPIGTDIMRNVPAADVVTRDCYNRLLAENDELRKERTVRHGRWIDRATEFCYRCSVCEEYTTQELPNLLYHYCPNCGARMDGDA